MKSTERSLSLAQDCRKSGECAQDDPLVDENRIRNLFKDTRSKFEKEHLARELKSRYSH